MSCARRCGARQKRPTISSGSPRISSCSLAPTAAVSRCAACRRISERCSRTSRAGIDRERRGPGSRSTSTLHPAPCASIRSGCDRPSTISWTTPCATRRGEASSRSRDRWTGAPSRLSVLDSGPGFSADVLSRAFEPFVGDPDAGGAGRDGAGLGLAIVRVIADAHGGSVAGGEHARRRRSRHDDHRGARLTDGFIASFIRRAASWALRRDGRRRMMKRIVAAVSCAAMLW